MCAVEQGRASKTGACCGWGGNPSKGHVVGGDTGEAKPPSQGSAGDISEAEPLRQGLAVGVERASGETSGSESLKRRCMIRVGMNL